MAVRYDYYKEYLTNLELKTKLQTDYLQSTGAYNSDANMVSMLIIILFYKYNNFH